MTVSGGYLSSSGYPKVWAGTPKELKFTIAGKDQAAVVSLILPIKAATPSKPFRLCAKVKICKSKDKKKDKNKFKADRKADKKSDRKAKKRDRYEVKFLTKCYSL